MPRRNDDPPATVIAAMFCFITLAACGVVVFIFHARLDRVEADVKCLQHDVRTNHTAMFMGGQP
jgi:hypothetical protein